MYCSWFANDFLRENMLFTVLGGGMVEEMVGGTLLFRMAVKKVPHFMMVEKRLPHCL